MSSTTAAAPIPVSRTAPSLPRWASLGILFGLVSAASIMLYGPIGVSGTYPRLVGAIARTVSPAWATTNPYLVKMGAFLVPESVLVIGLLIGGFLAARTSPKRVPLETKLVHANEHTPARRYVNAFLGGVLIIFGARLAGGCTSGHIISGITQLSLSGMLFAAGVFLSGIVTAKSLRRAT
jgi:uncharacterized membrane protein YedE/YeeE